VLTEFPILTRKMPLRDYVRSAFRREPDTAASASTAPAAGASTDKGSSAGPRWTLRGDLPSEKLSIPDTNLSTLASTVFRPHDEISGVITALHGALGTPEGFSLVKVALFASVRLVRASKKDTYYANTLHIGGMSTPISSDYDIDTFEDRMIEVAAATIYSYSEDGVKTGKEELLPFHLPIPLEADGFQLAPSLPTYMRVISCRYGIAILLWANISVLHLDDTSCASVHVSSAPATGVSSA
jgi:hypothetical protein